MAVDIERVDIRERPACRLCWMGRARMALGRAPENRDSVDLEALEMWPDPPSSLVPLDDIDPSLWPEHLEHRAREIEEAKQRMREAKANR